MDCASLSVDCGAIRYVVSDERMETKLTNAKPPRGSVRSARPRARTPPPVAAVTTTRAEPTPRPKTRIAAAGVKPKPTLKAKMNALVPKTRHARAIMSSTTRQLGVDADKPKTQRRGNARRTPTSKLDTARSKPRPPKSPVAKTKMATAVLQSAAKPRRGGKTAGKPVSRVVVKVAGLRTPPKTMRTVKKGTVQKTRVRVVCSSSVLRRRHEYIYLPCSRGDNTFGSVRVRVRVCVRLSVGALLFEPFDL